MEHIYSVTQVNLYIKNMFQRDYALNNIYIKGEVSNCKYHTSGHIYFTLKDAQGQISCVLFAGARKGLKFRMQEGHNVIVLGNINVYERDGKYQLYAREILLDGTGVLYEQFEQLKAKLESEGLFSPERKKAIPQYPNTAGIVTAKTGAAIMDIQNIISRRNPYLQLVLYPAFVQGEKAAQSIVRGIEHLDKLSLDVIIIGRGGGSIEDLWAFNEEAVARAVYSCQTPIISAVGHETDTTIVDYAADLRAPTPSAAAELVSGDIFELLTDLLAYENKLKMDMKRILESCRLRIDHKKLRLQCYNPVFQIQEKRQKTADLEEHLQSAMLKKLTKSRHLLELCGQKLHGLSPLAKLNQGYSYLQDEEGNGVYQVSQVKEGDMLTISVTDGEISAKVIDKKKKRRRKWQETKKV